MKADLQDHLAEAYDVDVEEQIAIAVAAENGETFHPLAAPQADRFIIDDEDKANWALRKLAKITAARDDVKAQARVEFDRIATWLDEQLTRADREAEFFEELLEQFHRNQLTADPRRKTINLPAGTLRARKKPPNVEIEDVDAFLEWAREERPEFVRTKYEVARTAVKDAACKDGEVLPHVAVEPEGVSYTAVPS